jgi:hypothetical protein
MDGDEQADRDEQSRLTRSFVDQARAAGPWRAGSQLVVTMLVVTVAAAGSIGYGFLTRPARHQAHRTSALALTGAGPAAAAYSALTGPGCPQSRSASFRVYGWFGSGLTGFDTVRSGGWPSQGCDGGYIAMPMSGSQATDDPQNYGLWTFRTGMPGSCQVSVYVPRADSIVKAGGNPAHYQVFDAASASGTPAGSFNVSQFASRGRWVSAGSYPAGSGFLTIKADSRGQDWAGNTKTYAHIALDVVRLACAG